MKRFVLGMAVAVAMPLSVAAENLFVPGQGNGLASDMKAASVGDVLTVIIVQSAEARNSARNLSDRSSGAAGAFSGAGVSESIGLSLGRDSSGVGEIRRSESFVTQMSVSVTDVLPNGDLHIAGAQFLQINGETTRIDLTGRIRPYDIQPDNTVLSSRIAGAEIAYEGEGFVTDSAKPGLVTRIFNRLGLF